MDLAETKVTTRELLTADGRCVQGKARVGQVQPSLVLRLEPAQQAKYKGCVAMVLVNGFQLAKSNDVYSMLELIEGHTTNGPRDSCTPCSG